MVPSSARRSAAALVLSLGLSFLSAPVPAAETTALRPLVAAGEKAPSFALKDLDGRTVAFRAGDGKAALIVFWSVFCPLCRELTPSVNEIARRHGEDVRVIGVNLDGKRFSNAVRTFLKENGIRFPVGLDALRNDFFIASDPYGVEKTPTAVIVGADGIVRGSYAAERMREMITTFESIAPGLKKGQPVMK